MQQIKGGCHCGNIRYEFLWPLSSAEIPVRACSCSFCVKHRGVYTSHPQAELKGMIADLLAVTKYTFGTETADFFVCSRCGVLSFVTSKIDSHEYAVVNVNTFETIDFSQLKSTVTNFNGETTESRLARRKRTWTPKVSISTPSP